MPQEFVAGGEAGLGWRAVEALGRAAYFGKKHGQAKPSPTIADHFV